MKSKLGFLLIGSGIGLIILGLIWEWPWGQAKLISPLSSSEPQIQEKPLTKYAFARLRERGSQAGKIQLEETLKEERRFTVHLFSYTSEGRKITGLAHLPSGEKKFPVVVMIRGYIDKEDYQTGMGTSRAGEFFAKQGFLTLAPDFLGYGQSDMPPDDVWEERFLKPVAVLDLLASLTTLPQADPDKICLWGHSNGGMVALSVLAISQEKYPTALWAPVSAFFPYDVLYFIDEFGDKGKALRYSLAEFEKEYNVDQYSFDEYLSDLQGPLLLHQGTADEWVPVAWSDSLNTKLEELGKEITYYRYPGADHNLAGAWETVVRRDIAFFQRELD